VKNANKESLKHQDPDMFMTMEDLELVARGVVEGTLHGIHRSPYIGFSSEFESHRDYQLGDDLRHVNWNIWARTDQLYIKQFKADTNMNLYILVDKSGSMRCKNGKQQKWDYAARAAAALAFLGLSGNDASGLCLLDDHIHGYVQPKVRPQQLFDILSMLHHATPESQADMSKALNEVAEVCKRKGIIFLLTDFFDQEQEILTGLDTLRLMGHQVIVMQILDPWELQLPKTGQYEFSDLETKERIIAHTSDIYQEYNKTVVNWQDNIKQECENRGIEFFSCLTTDPLKNILTNYLLKRTRMF